MKVKIVCQTPWKFLYRIRNEFASSESSLTFIILFCILPVIC